MPISLRLLIPFRFMISIHLGNGLQREDPPRPKKSINHCSSAKGLYSLKKIQGIFSEKLPIVIVIS
jgi:hypothetical protein